MLQNIIKESCVNNYQEALNAYENDADRVELCDNLSLGGTTPSYGTIKKTVETAKKLGKDLVVMIRPRGGNFVYCEDEKQIMTEDIQICKSLKVPSIITGALNQNQEIDLQFMEVILSMASPMKVVFHMAFDELIDYDKGFQQLIQLGVTRILTKGGNKKNALEGKQTISEWVKVYGDQIEILPGGGLTYENYESFVSETNVSQVHGTKIVQI